MSLLGALDFELGSGKLICEVDDLQLPRVDVEYGAYKDVLELEGSILAAFEEDTLVLDVELSVGRCTISMLRSLRK
jgi:hypothetical protein